MSEISAQVRGSAGGVERRGGAIPFIPLSQGQGKTRPRNDHIDNPGVTGSKQALPSTEWDDKCCPLPPTRGPDADSRIMYMSA
jgi:hypothetical protein